VCRVVSGFDPGSSAFAAMDAVYKKRQEQGAFRGSRHNESILPPAFFMVTER
jgi:hypothetical protein